MEQLLFSVFLEQAVSSMAGLFADILCPRCETPQPTHVTNVTHNYFLCPACGYDGQQYLNANRHTVNHDHSVSSAGVADAAYHVNAQGVIEVSNALTTANAQNHGLVVEARLGIPGQQPLFTRRTPKHLPRFVRERTESRLALPVQAIPLRDTPLAVDLTVYNEWGDQLDYRRLRLDTIALFAQLIWLNIRLLENEHKRLTLELKRLEELHRQEEQRYREIVLYLVQEMARYAR